MLGLGFQEVVFRTDTGRLTDPDRRRKTQGASRDQDTLQDDG